jgi:hypothetical protein
MRLVGADGIRLADAAAFQDGNQRVGMVVDVDPVAHVAAVSVERDRLAEPRAQDGERDQLFGKLVWPVVVAGVGDDDRQAVGALPGARQMVGCGLARRVG